MRYDSYEAFLKRFDDLREEMEVFPPLYVEKAYQNGVSPEWLAGVNDMLARELDAYTILQISVQEQIENYKAPTTDKRE